MPELNLSDAEDILEKQTEEQAERLIKMFERVKWNAEKQITKLGATTSDRLRKVQLKNLVQQLNLGIKEVYEKFEGQLDASILAVCQGVVDADNALLAELGINLKGAYASIPVDVLASIRTGQIYDEKWYLSNALWSDLKLRQREINSVLSTGLAMNESSLNIAKTLEIYVDPLASKASRSIKTSYFVDPNNPKKVYSADYVKKHPEMDWTGWQQKTGRYSFGKVDYNAQRLARTAIAHAYEQAVISSAKKNPLSQGIRWIAAMGERTCALCAERDGKIFAPDDIPLDHPNGMCTYAVELLSMDEISDRLADWVNGKEDEDLDNWTDDLFGGKFELKQEFSDLQNKYLSPYGFSPTNMPADFSDWSHKLSSADKKELFNDLGLSGKAHPFQEMQKWYEANLANVGTRTVFTPTTASTAPSSVLNNVFSQANKNAAKWFKGLDAKKEADAYYRKTAGDVWKTSDMYSKMSAYKYTSGSGSFNRPLRGYQGGWDKLFYKGVGKVPLDYEGSGDDIEFLTKLINRSSYADDVWLQRGVETESGILSFLQIDDALFRSGVGAVRANLMGKTVTDAAFLSCTPAKGQGFTGYIINFFCPKGTKMLYAEPWSAYSGAGGFGWDGDSSESYFGGEFEMILQRGGQYRITKVEQDPTGRWYFDVEVVGQNPD